MSCRSRFQSPRMKQHLEWPQAFCLKSPPGRHDLLAVYKQAVPLIRCFVTCSNIYREKQTWSRFLFTRLSFKTMIRHAKLEAHTIHCRCVPKRRVFSDTTGRLELPGGAGIPSPGAGIDGPKHAEAKKEAWPQRCNDVILSSRAQLLNVVRRAEIEKKKGVRPTTAACLVGEGA